MDPLLDTSLQVLEFLQQLQIHAEKGVQLDSHKKRSGGFGVGHPFLISWAPI